MSGLFRVIKGGRTAPPMREALELAAKDPELSNWLAHLQEFDEIFDKKLASICPPEGLKENILRLLEANAGPIPSWRTSWLALASTIVLVTIALSYQSDSFTSSTQSFRNFCSAPHRSSATRSGAGAANFPCKMKVRAACCLLLRGSFPSRERPLPGTLKRPCGRV